MEEDSTQPSTYPVDQNDVNRSFNNLSLEDELDIICLLRPCSRAAFDITEKIARITPQHVLAGCEIPQRYRKVMEIADEVESLSRPSPDRNGPEVTPDMAEADMSDFTDNSVSDIALRLSSRVIDMDMGFVFGRDSRKCDIVLPVEDKSAVRISGMHFRIFLNDNGMIMLEDTSTNGTLVDNFLLKHKHPLPGNSVRRIIQQGSMVAIFVKPDKTTARFIVDIPQRRDESAWRQRLEQYVAAVKRARNQKMMMLRTLGTDKGGMSQKYHQTGPVGVLQTDDVQPGENMFITAGTTPWNHGMRWNGGGRYNVVTKLGAGAFATVYKLVDANTGDELAAKEIEKRRFMKNGGLDVKITSELNILKRLKHPHVIESFDHVDTSRDLYILMELVPYGDLSIHIGASEPLGDNEMRLITKQMCQALAYLHDNGIAHRDIKPENIIKKMVNPLWIKLADFGLSKIITQDDHHTAYQTFCGTLLYCAPEVYPGFAFKRAGLPPDPRTTKPHPYSTAVDIWSLAAVLFHLLCGKPPYEASAANHGVHMLDTIFEERFPRQKFEDADVHADWELFFENTLQLTAQQRWSARRLITMPWIKRTPEVIPVTYEFQCPAKDFALEEESSDDEMDEIRNPLTAAAYNLPDASQFSLINDPPSGDEDDLDLIFDDRTGLTGIKQNSVHHKEGLGINVDNFMLTEPYKESRVDINHKLRSRDQRSTLRQHLILEQDPSESDYSDGYGQNRQSSAMFRQQHAKLFGEITESSVFGSEGIKPRIAGAPLSSDEVYTTAPNQPMHTKHSLADFEELQDDLNSPKRSRLLEENPSNESTAKFMVSSKVPHKSRQQQDSWNKSLGKVSSVGSRTYQQPRMLVAQQPVSAGTTARPKFPTVYSSSSHVAPSLGSNRSRSMPFAPVGVSVTNSSRPTTPHEQYIQNEQLLGTLLPGRHSVQTDQIHVTRQETQFGRASECTHRFHNSLDTRCPKSAFTIFLHDPDGVEGSNTDLGKDWARTRFYAVIGTRCSNHILINNIPMARNKSNDESKMQLGLLQSGDVIEVFNKPDGHLRFYVKFWFGAAKENRDSKKDPFRVLLGQSSIVQAIKDKELARSEYGIAA